MVRANYELVRHVPDVFWCSSPLVALRENSSEDLAVLMRPETLTPAELKTRLHKLIAQASQIRSVEELDRILLSFPGAAVAAARTELAKLPIRMCRTCNREHLALGFAVSEVNHGS